MDKTKFRLQVAAIAMLLASSIITVLIVAQRPHPSAAVSNAADTAETRVSHK